ncbi:Ulp1 protease [Trichophyton tonsurans CBS 112818]|uniref:Ulp1 protease n=1 Tax=Trichophyton tonsurans (strain CBS 112818) TaxID=647933 RepID=F2S0B9_TRIT1|nr:Ulp1 protease [Trichophyton tonsurans CBS 112818]
MKAYSTLNPSPPQVEETASLLEAIGLRSPEGARVKRPNWFELQNRNRDGMAGSSLEASLQFGSSSHGAVDANSLLSQIPGSWPASPPRPMAAPVDLPVQPSPEVKDAPPSPNSRAREFMMVGGIESAGPEGSTVVPRPADVPMTFLQPESRLLKTVECLRSVYSLPKCVMDCYGWTVQTSKNIISSAKRIAIDSWTSQTSQPTPLPAAALQSPRRRTEPRRDRKLPGSSTEQRRARHLQEKRMKRKKTASRAVRELQSSITGELYVPEAKPVSVPSAAPAPARASVPSITPGPGITTQPSIPEGVTPTDSSRKDESYDGYTPRPAGPRTRRRVHWHEASGAPLGQPVVDIRVYDPSAPIRPAAGVEDSQQPAHTTIDGKSPEGPFIKPISSKWDSRLTADMSLPDYRQVGTTISGDPLTRKDFATCYTPFAWLNDEVINAYLAIILDYARRASGSSGRHREPKYHAFNSFFYSSLRDRGYESVRRWASRAKIGGPALLGVEVVLIPIHNQAHWTLMVVKPKARTIEYFDSLGGASRAHISRVKEWLQGELCDLFVEEEWRVLPTDSPQQDNGSDCGVFLLTTAKLVVLGLPLSYGARDIPTIRKRIVAEILNGGFEGDFDPKVEFPVRPRL